MKYMRFAWLGLGLLLAVSVTQAQEAGVKANIPFDFIVGNRVLPAGEYIVKPVGDTQQAIWICSGDYKTAIASNSFACEQSRPSSETKMVFRAVGGQYFLSQVWAQGYSQGRELPMSKLERRLAKNNAEGEFVLAANLAN